MPTKENLVPLAAFDFCETLVDFQTADAFIDYVRDNSHGYRKIIMTIMEVILIILKKIKVISLLEKTTKHKLSISKRLKLLQLRDLSYLRLNSFAQDYYNIIIKPHLIPKLVSQMVTHQEEGLRIILVSGGYDIYLQYFAKDYNIQNLLCSHIKFTDGVCMGTIDGIDCMNYNKVKLIKEKYPADKYKIKYAYSDNISDIPMLKYADQGIVISHIKKQSWANNTNFNEIIW